MEHLNVYLHNALIGKLTNNKGRLGFQYTPEYVSNPELGALSYSIPVSPTPFDHDIAEPFFSNLLPDERIRKRIAVILRISEENTFALLKEIGEDCAGAVSLYQPGNTPEDISSPIYRCLSEDEADRILSHLEQCPLNIGEKEFHISGAGAQDKLIASLENGMIRLPLRGTPSTHIIKPGIKLITESVFNEYFCMRLALACDLSAAKCNILEVKGVPYYVTERYDRIENDGIWTRLHQEDFCQLLGYDPKIKYESEGGPSLKQCFELLRDMELPAADTLAFLKLVIFNFLIGNGDAHAKNFSVLYQHNQPCLAPAYDLMSTTVYPDITPKLAMKIDREYEFSWISTNKFIRMGEKSGLSPKLIITEISKMKDKMNEVLKPLVSELSEEFPSDIYEEIQAGICNRLAQLKT